MAAIGQLNGNTPDVFDGTRTKSKDFLQEFEILWEMNNTHNLFTEPYKRVMTALSYIRGPIVNDWGKDKVAETRDKVNRATNPINKADEVLWTNFLASFKAAYTDIAIKQNSYRKMIELQMKGDHIDNYVARFKHLAKEAGFPLDQAGTIDIFIKKIPKDLLTRMIERDNNFNPETATFDEWVAQAQDVIKKTICNTNILSTTWPTSWQRGSAFKQYKHTPKPQYSSYQHNHSSRNDDVVPMDIDVVRGMTTEQEKELYRHKGLCFECQGSGHMACYCPKKKQKQ